MTISSVHDVWNYQLSVMTGALVILIVLSQEPVQQNQLVPELWKLSLAISLLGSSITCLVVFLIDTENWAKMRDSSSCDLCSSSLVYSYMHAYCTYVSCSQCLFSSSLIAIGGILTVFVRLIIVLGCCLWSRWSPNYLLFWSSTLITHLMATWDLQEVQVLVWSIIQEATQFFCSMVRHKMC